MRPVIGCMIVTLATLGFWVGVWVTLLWWLMA